MGGASFLFPAGYPHPLRSTLPVWLDCLFGSTQGFGNHIQAPHLDGVTSRFAQ
jgi:hypothetical protein